ncbi:MAG: hypothetical protein JW888_16690 [Pirellulales bacterium]|nr:hypothetical protein [Pirellulales bacterium]
MFDAIVAISILCFAAGVERDTPKRVVQGDVCCRVLLIDFEGREHVHPRESFEAIFFGNKVRVTPDRFKEPMCGSARDYFGELSNGRLRLTGEVMPWVRSRLKAEELPHWTTTRDGGRDWWQPVVADAMSLNNIPKDDRINGRPVDFYAVIYAGPDRGYFKCLGKSVFMGAGRRGLSSRAFRKTKVPFWEDRWNGKQITFSPERWRQEESGLYGVGLLYHELGHMLCRFRDLYGEDNGDFGRYAIMAFGEKTHFPTGPIAFHRYLAGWLSYDVPAQRGHHRLRLPPLQFQRAVKLVNGPMPWADALIVEHRMRPSPQARTLPAEGLLVYETYGNRRVRTVRWDAKAKKPVMRGQWIRLLRADGTTQNQAGDVFREGTLTLFGNPSAASSATGCGFWELGNIHLPITSTRQGSSTRTNMIASFDAVYRPERVPVRRGNAPIHLAKRLAPGDYRLYVQVTGGAATIKGKDALLEMPTPRNTQPLWGLVDVRVSTERRRLSIVPSKNARIEEIQVVPRQPVLLNLLAQPQAQQLATSFGGRVTTGTALARNVWVGGAVEIVLGESKAAKATAPMTCPGGVLRLALRDFSPRKGPSPELTLVVNENGKKQTYLKRVALSSTQPEFFLVDCRHLRGKPIQLEFLLKGPEASRIVLWEAGFVAP